MSSMKKHKVRKAYLVENVHCTLYSWRRKMNKSSRKRFSNGEPSKGSKAASKMEKKVKRNKRVKIFYASVLPPTNIFVLGLESEKSFYMSPKWGHKGQHTWPKLLSKFWIKSKWERERERCAPCILHVFEVSGVLFQGIGIEWREPKTRWDLEESGNIRKGKWKFSIFGQVEATCTCMQKVCGLVIKGMDGSMACVWESYATSKWQNNAWSQWHSWCWKLGISNVQANINLWFLVQMK